MNAEFPVNTGHKLALIKSLFFLHTAHHYYTTNGLVRCYVLLIMQCTILLFRAVTVNDILCDKQVLARSGNLNAECRTGKGEKIFPFRIALKPKTRPANASIPVSSRFNRHYWHTTHL